MTYSAKYGSVIHQQLIWRTLLEAVADQFDNAKADKAIKSAITFITKHRPASASDAMQVWNKGKSALSKYFNNNNK
jgi:hypothetical protein